MWPNLFVLCAGTWITTDETQVLPLWDSEQMQVEKDGGESRVAGSGISAAVHSG